MALPTYMIAINYVAWFVFMFVAVVWTIVMISNRHTLPKTRSFKRLPVVSIMIPAYNEEKTIRRTIESVLSLDYPKKLLDIIVINDCSTDRTRKIAEEFARRGDVRLLNNKPNRGKAYSLNRAIKVCRGEFAACIDADSIVESSIIRKLLPCFHEDSVGSVTPALKVWRRESLLEKVQHAEYILNIFLRKALSFLDAVHVTPGVFSIYRLSVLKEVGGFDEDNLTEDMEMALKINEHGYSIESNMDAVSYTMCPTGWGELYRQRLRWYRGAIANMHKYRHMLFNPSYGNLGIFLLPTNLILIASIMVVFASTAYSYADSVASFAWRMSLINFDFLSLIGELDLSMALEELMTTAFVLGMVSMTLGVYLLTLSFRSTGTKVRGNIAGYALYLFVFPLIMMVFWSAAIIHEAGGARKKW